MQVSLLKLNAGISRAVETPRRSSARTRRLEASISRLASGERIRAAADKLGMVMPAAGEVHYLAAPGPDPAAPRAHARAERRGAAR